MLKSFFVISLSLTAVTANAINLGGGIGLGGGISLPGTVGTKFVCCSIQSTSCLGGGGGTSYTVMLRDRALTQVDARVRCGIYSMYWGTHSCPSDIPCDDDESAGSSQPQPVAYYQTGLRCPDVISGGSPRFFGQTGKIAFHNGSQGDVQVALYHPANSRKQLTYNIPRGVNTFLGDAVVGDNWSICVEGYSYSRNDRTASWRSVRHGAFKSQEGHFQSSFTEMTKPVR